MSKDKDMSQKLLEGYNDVFADIVNVLLFDGEEVMKEDELLESVTRSQYKVADKYHEQERDVAKFWRDMDIHIACVGIENQTNTDINMPLRVMSYDAGSYREQLLKNEDDRKNPTYPVITLVLHFNEKEHWTGPRSLLDSLDIVPIKFKNMVNDYRINVFEIAFLPRETIDKFKSDFWIVADYFWQQRNTPGYKPTERTMKHVQAVLQTMAAFTGDKRFEEVYNENYEEERKSRQGGEPTMCEFLDKIVEEGRNEFAISFIQTSDEEGKSYDTIIADLQKYFKLSEPEAKAYYDKYTAMQPV